MAEYIDSPERAVDLALERVGQRIVLAAPLGIGKPNPIVNAFYHRAKSNSSIDLTLFTALSLTPPGAGSGLKRRFLEPFLERHFGDYPRLDYVADLHAGSVPANIRICEFYLQSGDMLGNAHAQQHYISANYTHVARDMRGTGVNVLCQMVAPHPNADTDRFSLSANPDLTLDLVELLEARDRRPLLIAQANPELPYMYGASEVEPDYFDCVLDQAGYNYRPFAVPRSPVQLADHLIGLHASTLVRDGGTLQIGIGALGDAIAHSLITRHNQPALYRRLLEAYGIEQRYPELLAEWGGTGRFETGLYAASEMFMDSLLHLYTEGILKRRVHDDLAIQHALNDGLLAETPSPGALQAMHAAELLPGTLDARTVEWMREWGLLAAGVEYADGELRLNGHTTPARIDDGDDFAERLAPFMGERLRHARVLHAAFFLGSRWFYDTLHALPEPERRQFEMCRVSRINQLYRGEAMDRAQRLDARFMNTCMKMTLLGAAVSDQLAEGQVVSGVGGQHNFVAMAHALDDGRSVLMLRATRKGKKGLESNVVWEYPHHTIPRHQRDIVVTEYGIADLRGKTDAAVIKALVCVADSRFQGALVAKAKKAGKLEADWQVPERYRRNTPEALRAAVPESGESEAVFPRWPFGSDLDETERALAVPQRQAVAGGVGAHGAGQARRLGGTDSETAAFASAEARLNIRMGG